ALHAKSDGEQLKAQKMLDDMGAELAKLDPAGTGGTSSKAVRLNLPQKTGVIWNYEGPAALVYRLVLSPDSRKLALHYRGGYVIYDVETKKELLKSTDWGFGEAFTADSKVFMIAGNPLGVYEIKTGKPLVQNISRGGMVNDHPAFSSDGKYVFGFSSPAKTLDILEVQTGKKVKGIPLGAKGDVTDNPAVALSPDGKFAMVSGMDQGEAAEKQRFCRIIDLATEKITQNLPCFQESGFEPFKVSFLSDGKRAVGYKNRTGLTIWDIRSGKVLWEIKNGRFYAITPDGKRIATTDWSYLEILDVASGKVLQKITPEKPKDGDEIILLPGAMCFTPDGQYLFCGYNYYKDKGKELKCCGAFLVGIGQ
ncbi:MAG: PQQ-binding-like beta-propeller repeat protein, partial [Planctomycetes bacterium]|nr:PQQ-binding-like beta-propeller repeat protein [Planctomycetota bacterium]